jgi:nucleoside-diphosphate-sugar epimerase
MKRQALLIVGCGDLGLRVGTTLRAEGWAVHGVRRNIDALPAGFTAHRADYSTPGGLQQLRGLRPDTVLATFNPVDRSLAGYRSGFVEGARNLLDALGDHRPARVLFSSSTRVFAESRGAWVEESSPLSRDDERALAIIEAEQLIRDSGHAASVVRFAGIYGHTGGHLLARIARGELSPAVPGRWSNRIHREDCAGFLCHLLRAAITGEALAPVYIGVDDRPTLQHEVERWLAGEMGVDVGEETADFRGGDAVGKRCRNLLLHASGYLLRFPDFRSGYRAVLSQAAP